MDIRKLQRAIVDALEDVKGQDIKVFNTTHLTDLFDRVIIASGTSNRQTKALAASVRDKVKEAGGDIIAVEGVDVGEWVLVDCGDAVVHILQPQLRMYYNLEEIWGDKPVRVKLGNTGRKGLAKASEGDDDSDGSDEDNARAPLTPKPRTKPPLARLPEGMKEPSPPLGHEDHDPDVPRRRSVTKATTSEGPARRPAVRKTAGKTAAGKSAAKAPAGKTAGKVAGKVATKTTAAKTAAPARKRAPRAS
jgi:ribosome-associated protein